MTQSLAYEVKSLNPPSDLRPAAVLVCKDCQAVGKLPIGAWGNVPDKIEKAYNRMGWSVNVFNASRCFCPNCHKKRLRSAHREKQHYPETAKKETAMRVNPPPSTPRGGGAGVSSVKDLTPDQKAALRREMDATFDDAIGRWLDGNSDHLVSEKLGIPRFIVTEYRELSYGPLKEDPEIAAIGQTLAEAKRTIVNLSASIQKIEARLEEVRRKVGI